MLNEQTLIHFKEQSVSTPKTKIRKENFALPVSLQQPRLAAP
jgi:hypothetical protein